MTRNKTQKLAGFYPLSSMAEIVFQNKFEGERLNFNLKSSACWSSKKSKYLSVVGR